MADRDDLRKADMSCIAKGCSAPQRSRAMCPSHYQRWRRAGQFGDGDAAEVARKRAANAKRMEGCPLELAIRSNQWRTTPFTAPVRVQVVPLPKKAVSHAHRRIEVRRRRRA